MGKRRGHAVGAHAHRRGEVGKVLTRGEVGVDGGRLGDVADAAAQDGGTGGVAKHVDGSASHDLCADNRAHQRGLAAA